MSQKILREVLSGEIRGSIASIFDRSFNLEAGERFLINIGAEDLALTPRSILLSTEDFFEKIFPQIYLGLPFATLNGVLYFPPIRVLISVQEAAQFNPKGNIPREILPRERIARNLIAAANCFRRTRKTIRGVGCSPLSDYFLSRMGLIASPEFKKEGLSFPAGRGKALFYGPDPKLWDRIDSFLCAARKRSGEGVTVALGSILGFGPGLTPSGDDFLSGFITAGIAVSQARGNPPDAVNKIIEKVNKEAKGKTTRVSIAMMEDAGNGEMAAPVWKFIQTALLSEEMGRVIASAHKIGEMGGSSGEDLFNGLATGIWYFLSSDS